MTRMLAAVLVVVTLGPPARGADEFEQPPIEYSQTTPSNPVSQLQARLASGEAKLAHDERRGYLPALLAALEVPVESQMLVFSKTSLQRQRITPRTPRALYFNDDCYIGYCHQGDVLEVSVADPQLGTVFYTLDQAARERPQFVRQSDNCLLCHSSSRTEGVPGHVVRSLLVDTDGQPLLAAGSFAVDQTTPVANRWGGWFVTGTHGEQTHLGNLVIRGKEPPQPVENVQGQNVTDLTKRTDIEHYLTGHSDIVALMVHEHQTLVHNRITKANFATRQALHYEQTLKAALGENDGKRLESTTRRIASAGDDLVEALLLVDEAKLAAPIRGTSGFAEKFVLPGLRDSQGRSLRDLDLTLRMFKHPCSYLIFSPSFDALPAEAREYVWQRLYNVLVKGDDAEKFVHLSAEDRQAIVGILRETKQGLPEYWRAAR